MRLTLFCHSLLSDWNHGNAHFLRGVVTELVARGHAVSIWEPRGAWSAENLRKDHGDEALEATRAAYPALDIHRYDASAPDLDAALDGADLVLVHEWSEHPLVEAIGARRANGGRFKLLFHDTHHRAVSDPGAMGAYALEHFDGALVFGRVLADVYRTRGWAARTWVWHEAADTRVFYPRAPAPEGVREDLVWIGNWGDDERAAELSEFLLGPVKRLGLRASVHGVRYPDHARAALAEAGIRYRGWLANYDVPEAFARHRVTVHVPRRPYVEALVGIPTIRPFEALACGIPLVSAPWNDTEGLFTPGEDFLVARDGAEMERHLRAVLHEPGLAARLATRGRRTIEARHTCAHRVDELLSIVAELGVRDASVERSATEAHDARGVLDPAAPGA